MPLHELSSEGSAGDCRCKFGSKIDYDSDLIYAIIFPPGVALIVVLQESHYTGDSDSGCARRRRGGGRPITARYARNLGIDRAQQNANSVSVASAAH